MIKQVLKHCDDNMSLLFTQILPILIQNTDSPYWSNQTFSFPVLQHWRHWKDSSSKQFKL